MYQIDNLTAVAAIPPPSPVGTVGYFTDGNPATGMAATILPAEFMNMLMMENLNVLSAADITPVKGQYNQLALAIAKICGSSQTWANIGNTPTTLAGYGITDAPTTTQMNTALSTKADKATTLAGYDITDAMTTTQVGAALGAKADRATTLGGYGITDGVSSATYNAGLAAKQANLGFTPVRQSGGAWQGANTVYLGWDGAALRAQVDASDLGRLITQNSINAYMPAGMASVGIYGIGSYCLCTYAPGGPVNPGAAVAGSTLRPAPTAGYTASGALPGAWICCGLSLGNGNSYSTTLFQRIS